MPRTLVASDCHLSERIWASAVEITGDAYFGLSEVVELALQLEVDQVLLAGDLFDTFQPTSTSVHCYYTQVERLAQAGVQLGFIEGQHDRTSRVGAPADREPPWGSLHPHAKHLHGQTFTLGPHLAYALDWQHPDELPFALARLPPAVTTLLCHQAWREFLAPQARSDGSLQELPGFLRFVFTGDRHEHGILPVPERQLQVYSPGATHLRKKNEPLEYGVFVVENDGTVMSYGIRSRPLYRYTITKQEAYEEIVAKLEGLSLAADLPAAVARPLVLVDATWEFAQLLSLLSSPARYYLRVSVLEDATVSPERPGVRSAPSDDLLEQTLQEACSGDPLLQTEARLLLDAHDPRRYLEDKIHQVELEHGSC